MFRPGRGISRRRRGTTSASSRTASSSSSAQAAAEPPAKTTAKARYALDCSNRIYQVMGIRPAIYINGNYASILQNATASQRSQLAQPSSNPPNPAGPAYPQLWSARWPNQADPNSIPVQTGH